MTKNKNQKNEYSTNSQNAMPLVTSCYLTFPHVLSISFNSPIRACISPITYLWSLHMPSALALPPLWLSISLRRVALSFWSFYSVFSFWESFLRKLSLMDYREASSIEDLQRKQVWEVPAALDFDNLYSLLTVSTVDLNVVSSFKYLSS